VINLEDKWQFPSGKKIAEKAVCVSVFLTT